MPLELPETTVPPRVSRGQLASVFSLGVVFVDPGVDLGLRLLAGPADALIVVAENGHRWEIAANGKILVETRPEVPHAG